MPPSTPPPQESFDPNSGCQRALAHLVTLAIHATGSGPSNAQRSSFLERCVATAVSSNPSECVLGLKSLPGRRGAEADLGPAFGCLKR